MLKYVNDIPVISKGFCLEQDQFSGGRIGVTVAKHGGITKIIYYGQQRLGDRYIFQADPVSTWTKLFRLYVVIDSRMYYLTFRNTHLYPFGYQSECEIDEVQLQHEMVLLNDAIVQRVKILQNPKNKTVSLKMLHHGFTRIESPARKWKEYKANPRQNCFTMLAIDVYPKEPKRSSALAQRETFDIIEPLRSETRIAISSELPLQFRKTYKRHKEYIESKAFSDSATMFVLFGTKRKTFEQRLKDLQKNIHKQTDEVLTDYRVRLTQAPKLKLANESEVLSSALHNVPAVIDSLKVKDIPGAIRATAGGYWVWGWDSMVHAKAFLLAGDGDFVRQMLDFFHKTANKQLGIPHALTTRLKLAGAMAFPAQCLYIIMLYDYIVYTGDTSVLKKFFPFCKWLLNKTLEREVKQSGLIEGVSLYPDFPECLDENGHDISSFNNSIFYQAVHCTAYLANLWGDTALAESCHDLAERCRKNFIKYLFDSDKGYFIDSCSSRTFKQRLHYPLYAILWLTPFARDLVEGHISEIADFMKTHFHHPRGLYMFPRWDSSFMADGNQIGAYCPVIEGFYYHMMRLSRNKRELKHWENTVKWNWKQHTIPEGLTTEAENEGITLDNPGTKQLFAAKVWYSNFFDIFAGIEATPEGLKVSPCYYSEISINNLRLRGKELQIAISGRGSKIAKIELNGRTLTANDIISWDRFNRSPNLIKITRTF